MTYYGHVRKGIVVLDQPAELPDGIEVVVRPVNTKGSTVKAARKLPTVAQRLAPFIGKLKGLPSDLSVNLDHYLYGVPKRKRNQSL